MLTSLGRFLRKIRIDHGEVLKDMADKLGVTASFLSAVENGKKRMPSSWNSLICSLYELNNEQMDELTRAIAESENKIELDFTNASGTQRELAVSFARKFNDFDERQLKSFIELLRRGNDNK
mgnify:CR=1 FL=1